MLHRQRVLLEFLRVADRPVTRLELTKWSFLLRYDTDSSGGSAFYDFLPYRFGPFSFALYQELDKLGVQSYVREGVEKAVELVGSSSRQGKLSSRVEGDISRIIRRVGDFSRTRLIDHVYSSFPRFTFNSEIRKLVPRPSASNAVYTAGYEGRSVDAFLDMLMQAGVKRLVDVRMNPVARRYGFHKSTLNRLCGKLNIDYQHAPTLGIRSEKRQSLDSQEDYDALFADYEATTLRDESAAIDVVAKLVADRPTVLVCMEANHACCHRASLANEVARRTNLPIEHLGSIVG